MADPAWTPLVTTLPFPAHPSGHSCVSSTASTILAASFGEHAEFSVTSDGMPIVVRYFDNFSGALDAVTNARVFGGVAESTFEPLVKMDGRSTAPQATFWDMRSSITRKEGGRTLRDRVRAIPA